MHKGHGKDVEGAQKRCSKDVEAVQKNLHGAKWVPKLHRMSVEGCLSCMERAWNGM